MTKNVMRTYKTTTALYAYTLRCPKELTMHTLLKRFLVSSMSNEEFFLP